MNSFANRTESSGAQFKIMYDGMIFQRQTAGGINRYFEKLIDRLPGYVSPSMLLSHVRPTNFPQNRNLQLHNRRFELPKPFRSLGRTIQRRKFKKVSQQIQPDLVHATYYDTLGGCERSRTAPLVITVHDMTHELFPKLLDRRGKHAAIKRRAIEEAEAIICVSNKTRNDLLDFYPDCESRTTVIHHATELNKVARQLPNRISDRPYFLYVGSRSVYKNFDRLLRALNNVIPKTPEVLLRAVGAPFNHKELDRISELGLQEHVINEGYVSDERLAVLYRTSIALAYPSLYEGFGLPLLEAMSCQTPVMAANSSCIPEVVGDAALLFDPTSVEQITDSMKLLLTSTTQRQALIARGVERCKLFSWSKTASQTVDVYRSVVASARMRNRTRVAAIPVLQPNIVLPTTLYQSAKAVHIAKS